MNLNFTIQLKNHKKLIVNAFLYLSCALLIAIAFSYFIFADKIVKQRLQIDLLDQRMLVYASAEQAAFEKEVFTYKKKVDDFTKIIDSHRISSNLFDFLEKNTLPSVWFSNINVSEIRNEIGLVGEAQNMEALSHQVEIFETSKDYIDKIGIFNIQTTLDNKIRFTVTLTLNSSIFNSVPNENK